MSIIIERGETADQPTNYHRRHGWLFYIKRSLLALAILLLALPVLGFSYETIMAIGQHIAGGHHEHQIGVILQCSATSRTIRKTAVNYVLSQIIGRMT